MSWSLTLMSYLAGRFFFAVMIVFGALSAIALSLDLADLFSRTTERGIPPDVVISMSLLKLPDIAQKLLPFAVLLGAIFAFSRMSRNHELVATRAAGVSAWQFLTPPLLVAVMLGVLTMTVFNPMSSAFLSQYTRLEARYVHGQASQLAVSSTGLWLRQGDASHQSVVHALRVADQGVHLEEVIRLPLSGPGPLCRPHRCSIRRSPERPLASGRRLGQRNRWPPAASRRL